MDTQITSHRLPLASLLTQASLLMALLMMVVVYYHSLGSQQKASDLSDREGCPLYRRDFERNEERKYQNSVLRVSGVGRASEKEWMVPVTPNGPQRSPSQCEGLGMQ